MNRISFFSVVFFLLFFLLFILLGSCSRCNRKVTMPEIESSPVEHVKIHRYGLSLFSINQNEIKSELIRLSDEFRFFLDADFNDTLNIIQIQSFIQDTFLIRLSEVVFKEFPDLAWLEKEFTGSFGYYKTLYPDLRVPEVYTYISGIDFENPVRFADSVIIIGLDNYLGEESVYYQRLMLPRYKRQMMYKDYIIRDAMLEMALTRIPYNIEKNRFIDYALYQGKLLLFLDLVLPEYPDHLKIGYTEEQYQWCFENEAGIWKVLLDEDILFSSDREVINKFLADAPFTASLPRESPGRVGAWVGWQILRKCASENQEADIIALFEELDSQIILNQSKYKPRK